MDRKFLSESLLLPLNYPKSMRTGRLSVKERNAVKEKIRELRKSGISSVREISKATNVSEKTVRFLLKEI
jgi:predicted transcriptional regulator